MKIPFDKNRLRMVSITERRIVNPDALVERHLHLEVLRVVSQDHQHQCGKEKTHESHRHCSPQQGPGGVSKTTNQQPHLPELRHVLHHASQSQKAQSSEDGDGTKSTGVKPSESEGLNNPDKQHASHPDKKRVKKIQGIRHKIAPPASPEMHQKLDQENECKKMFRNVQQRSRAALTLGTLAAEADGVEVWALVDLDPDGETIQ
mmetsp:Transcript_9041/g.21580  ORF Transcript_9041/g.21580 Transcript_9041/m.21580 type:complete len:204 (+) Transcript_9041:886-1497(+)